MMGTTCSTYKYKCTKLLDSLEERADFVDIEVVRNVALRYYCASERGCAGSGIGAIVSSIMKPT
jgi:hypothetical protein